MIKTDLLRGKIAERGYHQTDVARALDITPKTFYLKMEKGIFGSDEIQKMIDFLKIEEPMKIFLPMSNLKSY